jgi:hypothetical protein
MIGIKVAHLTAIGKVSEGQLTESVSQYMSREVADGQHRIRSVLHNVAKASSESIAKHE